MIVIGSNTSDNGQSCFTEDVSHFMELRQNRQLALLKRSAKNSDNVKKINIAIPEPRLFISRKALRSSDHNTFTIMLPHLQ